MAFLSNNIGTILTIMILLGIVAAIVRKLIRDKQKGKCAGCPYGRGNCPGSSSCNT